MNELDDRGLRKKLWHRGGNRMIIDTGHKTFDRQCDCISTGNVWGDVQHSSFIRAFDETECNGFSNSPGHLQDFDLKYFIESVPNIPVRVLKEIKEATKTISGILYQFRHFTGPSWNRCKIVHGYVLTDEKYKVIKKWQTNGGHKSWRVLEAVLPYMSISK